MPQKRPVRRPTSRVTHAQLAEGYVTPPRPPSLEGLARLDAPPPADGVVLVALRVTPDVTLEGPAALAERIAGELHGRWFRVFNVPHQMFTVGAWAGRLDAAGRFHPTPD